MERLEIKAGKQASLLGYDGVTIGGRTVSIKGKKFSFFTVSRSRN